MWSRRRAVLAVRRLPGLEESRTVRVYSRVSRTSSCIRLQRRIRLHRRGGVRSSGLQGIARLACGELPASRVCRILDLASWRTTRHCVPVNVLPPVWALSAFSRRPRRSQGGRSAHVCASAHGVGAASLFRAARCFWREPSSRAQDDVALPQLCQTPLHWSMPQRVTR